MRKHSFMKVAVVVLALSLSTAPARAEVDFSGQTITVIVPFGEGGGTSRIFGFFGPFLQIYLPGNPLVQMLNELGVRSTKRANQYHNTQTADDIRRAPSRDIA